MVAPFLLFFACIRTPEEEDRTGATPGDDSGAEGDSAGTEDSGVDCGDVVDEDGDGAFAAPADACDTGALGESDCDDHDASVHPGAVDACGDGVDGDCEGGDASCSALAGLVGESGEAIGWALDYVADADGTGASGLVVGGLTRAWLWRGGEGVAFLPADVPSIAVDGIAGEAAGLGDLDGDGIDEVLVGVMDSAALHVLPGRVEGLAPLEESRLVVTGEYSWMPRFVAGVGDVVGDAVPDVAIGGMGTVAVLDGTTTGTVGLDAAAFTVDTRVVGDDGSVSWGSTHVARAGDVDGDGLEDLVVAAGIGGGGAGVFRGPLAGAPALDDADTRFPDDFAILVASAGDVDGDGRDEVMVADSVDVALFDADAEGTVLREDAPARLDDGASGFPGYTMGAPGDLDGDGFADVGLANPLYGDRAAVWVVHGPVAGSVDVRDVATAVVSATPDGALGVGQAWGDLDGDGVPDLAIGESGAYGGAGAVWVFSGTGL